MAGLNEANTFSRIIYPYLEDLDYPARKSGYCLEQDRTKTKASKNSRPWDAVFMVSPNRERPVLLVEAKAKDVKIVEKHIKQAQEYAFGDRFAPVPPPYMLVSNGSDHRWFKRKELDSGDFEYVRCDEIRWQDAKKAQLGGQFRAKLTIKRIIKLMQNVRRRIYEDFEDQYFPRGFDLKTSKLGRQERACFDAILETRKSFVDPTLTNDEKSIKAILSSVALSWTLKILFLKVLSDIKGNADDDFPSAVLKAIKSYSHSYPGIMQAAPYDGLPFSKAAEQWIVDQLTPVRIAESLLFENSHNPIGDIYDGLVDSEELDLQVKSLGNVYTPEAIVKAMVDCAERALGSWKDKTVLEPSCGSGHFVRELYSRMRQANLPERIGDADLVVNAHKKTLANLRAVDVDPFATQTTQLGIFLELFGKPGVWKKIAPKGTFDLSKVVIKTDTLDDKLGDALNKFKPNLIIGNPPYGVSVTDEIKKKYGLESADSYGCFVARGIDLLPEHGHLIFVLSSSFLTTRWHRDLREKIATKTAIRSVHIMHRNAFRTRDVFPALLHLEKSEHDQIESAQYRFTDAWPVHPDDDDYEESLRAWARGEIAAGIAKERFGDYQFPQKLCSLRLMPPHANRVEKVLIGGSAPRSLVTDQEPAYPIVGGLPSLFLFTTDAPSQPHTRDASAEFPGLGKVEALEVKRGTEWVPVVKLWQIADVRVGLQTSDDERFLRKTPGIIPNARRRNIRDVPMTSTVSQANLQRLTEKEKQDGIAIIDPQRDKYFVPLDKGGEQDTAAGELRAYWSPVDYWIDWSEESVRELKRRAKWPAGKPKRPRFQNAQYYFQPGIRFSRAGLYAPMFELSFGGVFSDKGSLIIANESAITLYLLAVLNSQLCRYLTKSFIYHGVMTEVDAIRQIPIMVPTVRQFDNVTTAVQNIVELKRTGQPTGPQELMVQGLINEIAGFDQKDTAELNTWFRRRYPNFGREKNATTKSEKAARRKVKQT